MRGTIAATNIVKAHGARLVLRGVSLTVTPASRLGIVGPNGIGKTTLLRALAGLEPLDRGHVRREPPALEVGYLTQEPDLRRGETLLGYLARRTGVASAEAEMDTLAARLGVEPELAETYSGALERYLALGGADLPARSGAVLGDLEVHAALDAPLATMSGGEIARVALAALMLSRFGVYLLDEPTNNLDLAGIERLEGYLGSLDAGVVVVSHDREFLDRTVTRILELEAETGTPREYAGGWSEYERIRGQERRSRKPRTGSTQTNAGASRSCFEGGGPRRASTGPRPAAGARTRSGRRFVQRSGGSSGSTPSTSRGRHGSSNSRSRPGSAAGRLPSVSRRPWSSCRDFVSARWTSS